MVKRGFILHVSCAKAPRLCRDGAMLSPDVTTLTRRPPLLEEPTLPKDAICPYDGKLNDGERRRKSTPNFRLCAPLCSETLSTILTCCWRFDASLPSCKAPFFNARTRMTKTASPAVKGLGNGSEADGTAPPKLSWEKEPEPLDLL